MTADPILRLYDSRRRAVVPLQPLVPGRFRMYVCGVTVYDLCHIGHARVLVMFDVLVRYLRARDLDVHYVRNITDIDDKIIARANERGEDVATLTNRFIAAMHEDLVQLSVLAPDEEPRATDHMDQIIEMIDALVRRGYAYRAGNRDVYYDVSRFNRYGGLSGERLDALRVGARVEVDQAKDDPLDFVLWKAAKPGEPSWPSPWGPGRPGWHIECSAMSTHCLGTHFDLHGGGQDLVFPHHENEIAQSVAATGDPFVEHWMHVGFVRVNEEKMSKSLGNFFTIREVLARYCGEVIRFFLIGSHYRSPLNYSTEQLDAAKAGLDRLYTALRGLPTGPAPATSAYRERFQSAMDEDLNTPEAVATLFDLAREINRLRETDSDGALAHGGLLRELGDVLGILQSDAQIYLQQAAGGGALGDTEIAEWIERRRVARAAKEWAEADRIRDHLFEHGVVLEDAAGETTWRRR